MSKKHSAHPEGYALLLAVILLTLMVTISLTVTTLLIRQVRLTVRGVDAAAALAAADSGTERALYVDFKGTGLSNLQTIDSTGLPPFGGSSSSYGYNVTVTITATPTTSLNSVGRSASGQRALQLNY